MEQRNKINNLIIFYFKTLEKQEKNQAQCKHKEVNNKDQNGNKLYKQLKNRNINKIERLFFEKNGITIFENNLAISKIVWQGVTILPSNSSHVHLSKRIKSIFPPKTYIKNVRSSIFIKLKNVNHPNIHQLMNKEIVIYPYNGKFHP